MRPCYLKNSAMFIKHPIDPARMRKLPPRGFGWIDHRFLRDGHLANASVEALALYLLLACASDAQGLSYYSDVRTAQLLGLESAAVVCARRELICLRLILYRAPVYQLLSLEESPGAMPPAGTVRHLPQQPQVQPHVASLRQPPPPSSSEALETDAPRRFPLRAAVEEILTKRHTAA